MLGIGAAVSHGSRMPDATGCESKSSTHGRVLLVSDQEHSWRQLSAAGVPRELSSTLELRDPGGKVGALLRADLRRLAETLERVRPTLAIVAGLGPREAGLIEALASLTEGQRCALVAVSAERMAPEVEALAHSVLRTFERPSGRFALRRGLRHWASRIGRRGASIGFSLRSELVSWEGIIEDPDGGQLAEIAEQLEPEAPPTRTIIPFVTTPEAALKVVDPESAFLLEQLAQGPRR